MKTLRVALFLLTIALLISVMSSCAYRLTNLPKLNIAGPAINENTFIISDYKIADKEVKGEDYYSIVLFIPIHSENQDLVEGMIYNAIEKICKEKNYKFMTNVKIYHKVWYIPFIYGQYHIIIEGEGWSKKDTSLLKLILNNEVNEYYLTSNKGEEQCY